MTDNLKETTADAYAAARATLGDADFTAGGAPKLDAINAALEAAGFAPIGGKDRKTFEAALVADADAPAASDDQGGTQESDIADLPEPESAVQDVRIDAAACNPLPLYIHGVGQFSLRVGETYPLPPDAIAALVNVEGCEITIIEKG